MTKLAIGARHVKVFKKCEHALHACIDYKISICVDREHSL